MSYILFEPVLDHLYAFYAVSFGRRYRDTEGYQHSSSSFNTEDLLELAKLADQAHTCTLERRGSEAE